MAAEIAPQVTAIATDREGSDEPLEIVLELQQPGTEITGSRAERMAKQREFFQSVAEPVKAIVFETGGTIEAEAWINCTLKARVPAKALKRLREIDGVLKIDIPHTISREG